MRTKNLKNLKEYSESPLVVIARYIKEAFDDLRVPIPLKDVEAISCFINQAYAAFGRTFHNAQHAIDVGQNCAAVGRLAALFHDVVYIGVDRFGGPDLQPYLYDFNLKSEPSGLASLVLELSDAAKRPDAKRIQRFQALMNVFGFSKGQKIDSTSGLNEFLSAWIAWQMLGHWLPEKICVQVAGCIEATIPFRGHLNNPTVIESLITKSQRALGEFGQSYSEPELEALAQQAVLVSNNDVWAFGTKGPDVFIHNSWALLFESNHILQDKFFSLKEYRQPLLRMKAFFGWLDCERIYIRHNDYPSDTQMAKLKKGSRRNLEYGKMYIRVKLVAIAIIEAFAKITGGDAPVELFTGAIPQSREDKILRLETLLSFQGVAKNKRHRDPLLWNLFMFGRAYRSPFDTKASTLSAYLYLALDETQMPHVYENAVALFEDKLEPQAFLDQLPNDVVQYVGSLLAAIAYTRASAIQAYLATHARKRAA